MFLVHTWDLAASDKIHEFRKVYHIIMVFIHILHDCCLKSMEVLAFGKNLWKKSSNYWGCVAWKLL